MCAFCRGTLICILDQKSMSLFMIRSLYWRPPHSCSVIHRRGCFRWPFLSWLLYVQCNLVGNCLSCTSIILFWGYANSPFMIWSLYLRPLQSCFRPSPAHSVLGAGLQELFRTCTSELYVQELPFEDMQTHQDLWLLGERYLEKKGQI